MSEHNSLLGLKIMDILREHTNINHGLSQQEIVKLLEDEYETEVDRKTVGRNLKLLLEYDDERHIGYETLKRTQNGKVSEIRTNFYYKSDFEIGEMQVVLDSILSNRHISMKYTKELIKRICGNHKEFKRQWLRSIAFYDTYYKQDIPDLFLNLEKILDAIEEKKDISICECERDENLKLVEGRKRRVSPVQLFMYEQTYYLLALRDTARPKRDSGLARKVTIFRVEDLKVGDMYDDRNNAEEEFKKLQPGASFAKLLESFPYMEFNGTSKVETMTFVIPKQYLNDVVARFVTGIRIKEIPDSDWGDDEVFKVKMVRVTVRTTRQAMQRFIAEHRTHLLMIEPSNINYNFWVELKRDTFVKMVMKHALSDEEREKLGGSDQSLYARFMMKISGNENLSAEDKAVMKGLIHKMAGQPSGEKKVVEDKPEK